MIVQTINHLVEYYIQTNYLEIYLQMLKEPQHKKNLKQIRINFITQSGILFSRRNTVCGLLFYH